MRKKIITTTVDRELYQIAVLKNIQWSKAIDIGLRVLLNYKEEINKNKEKIKKEIIEHKAKLISLQSKLKNIEVEEEEKKAKEPKRDIISPEQLKSRMDI